MLFRSRGWKINEYGLFRGDEAVAGRTEEDVYEALMGLGHTPIEARTRLDSLLGSGKAFGNINEALTQIYGHRG